MSEGTLHALELAVEELLQQFRARFPTMAGDVLPIEEIVSWLGVEVATFHPEDYPPGTFGFVDPGEDEQLIWLCRGLSGALRRFTLAHELGHLLLHTRWSPQIEALLGGLGAFTALCLRERADSPSGVGPCQEADIVLLDQTPGGPAGEQGPAASPGEELCYNPRSARERLANSFAACLLMPRERVRALYLERRVALSALAGAFAVSEAALLNRLVGVCEHPLPGGGGIQVRVGGPAPLRQGEAAALAAAVPVPPEERPPFDEFQRAAIESPLPALIIAGPGSGKTSTLIGRVEHMVNALGIHPGQILALTFSRKAAGEMEARIRRAIGGAAPVLPRVCTFHAYCAELLRAHGHLVGLRRDFELVEGAEGYFLLLREAERMELRHLRNFRSPTAPFAEMLGAISRARDELVSPERYARLANEMLERAVRAEDVERAERAVEVARVYSLYDAALRERGDCDFGGLLTLSVQLLREHPSVLHEQRQRYRYLLVDEYQDVNRASGVLLKELAGEERRVWVVGDANQAIYAFRGGSPANVGQFTQDFPGATVLTLGRNYRSRPDLVELAESFRFSHLGAGREGGRNLPARPAPGGAGVTVARSDGEEAELEGIVQDIARKRAEGYAFRDMAVLCRTKAHVRRCARALASAGTPVVLVPERVLEQDHIKDTLGVLLLLADQGGKGLLRASRQPEHPLRQGDVEALLLAARERGVGVVPLIVRGEFPCAASPAGHASLARIAEILRALQHTPDVWSLLAQYLFIETSLVREPLRSPGDERSTRVLAEYMGLLQMARAYDRHCRVFPPQPLGRGQGVEAPSLPDWMGLRDRARGFLEYLKVLAMFRQDGPDQRPGEGSVGDEVRVSTVHSSKGLEFPVVYLPGLVQRRFPAQPRPSAVPAPEGMLPPGYAADAVHASEEACLFYVGITRARDSLVLSYSEQYGKQRYRRSPYLDAILAELPGSRLIQTRWEAGLSPRVGAVGGMPPGDTGPPQPSEAFVAAGQPGPLSARDIELYQQCPRKYAYRNIYRLEDGREDPYRAFSLALQRTIEGISARLQTQGWQEGGAPSEDGLAELFLHHWRALGGPALPFAAMYERQALVAVSMLARGLFSHGAAPCDIQPTLSITVSGTAIQVTVDRVEAALPQGAPPRFVRIRLGIANQGKPPVEVRELLYLLAYRQFWPGHPLELLCHDLSTGEVVPVEIPEKRIQRLSSALEENLGRIDRHEYPARPSDPFACPGCPYYWVCPA